jgi:hypothetical protein
MGVLPVMTGDWLPTREAMAYIGVRRRESMPIFIDLPPVLWRALARNAGITPSLCRRFFEDGLVIE